MIDLKSKILFSEDPTSENQKKTIQLAKAASEAGFNKLVATPSFTYHKDYASTYEYNIKKCEYINNLLMDNKIDIKVYFGNEINYTPEVIELLKGSKISTINNTRYILLKFDKKDSNFYRMIDSAFRLQIAGYIPIISHIEMYDIVIENHSIVDELIERDILIQLDALSIIGLNGDSIKITAKNLLKNDMVHILGTNASKPDDYVKITNALNKISKIVGRSKFEEITITNGELILNNQSVYQSNPKEIKKRLFR